MPVPVHDKGGGAVRCHSPSAFEVDTAPGIAEPEATVERGHKVRQFWWRHVRRVYPRPTGFRRTRDQLDPDQFRVYPDRRGYLARIDVFRPELSQYIAGLP